MPDLTNRTEASDMAPSLPASRSTATSRQHTLAEVDIDAVPTTTVDLLPDPEAPHGARTAESGAAARYKAMTEATADAVIGADAQGRITSWNPAATRTFGHAQGDVLGEPLTILIPERYRERHTLGLKRLGAGGTPRMLGRTLELVGLHALGYEFPIEMSLASWDDGGQLGFIAAIRDVTMRRRAEDHIARYAAIVGASSDAIIATDLVGIVSTWNLGAQTLYGYSEAEAVGRLLAELIVPVSLLAEKAEDLAQVVAGETVQRETTRRRHDGTLLDVHIVLSPIHDVGGQTTGVVAIHRDISERKRVDAELARATARFRVCFEHAPIGMTLTSLQPEDLGRLLDTNDALSRMLGHSGRELRSLRLDQICADDDRDALLENLGALSRGDLTDFEVELRLEHQDGRTVWVMLSCQALTDDHGAPEYAIAQASDVSDRKATEQQLAFQALHDPLTGVANRRLLEDRLAHALARGSRNRAAFALLYLDLDQFKQVNDAFGHALGDVVLQALTERIKPVLRANDTLARLGGDEFVILLESLSTDDEAHAVAARVHASLDAPIDTPAGPLEITTSIGIVLPQPGDDARTLLRNADTAMYRAKGRGRGGSELFDSSLARYAIDHLRIERDLRSACAEDRLVLHYQPIVEAATGQVHSVEALLRYRTRSGRLVHPQEFIAHAEEAGMLEAIGEWSIPEACHQLARWRQTEHPNLAMAVNVSARQLSGDHLLRTVTESLQQHALPANALIIELTESVVVDAVESAMHNLRRLKDLGVKLAMDDFGTGYSALTNLRRIPLDQVKIDQQFVNNMQREAESASIVAAILGIANALHLDVVAEGVETVGQAAALANLGCEHLQGYLLGSPVPAPDLDLTRRSWPMQALPHPRPEPRSYVPQEPAPDHETP